MAQRDQSLLDRLRGAGSNTVGSGAFDRHVAYESVRRNIERVCGARQGMAEAQADYGLPDIDFGAGITDAITQIRRAVGANIEAYEPRLDDVSVLPAEVTGEHGPAVLVEGRHRDDPQGSYAAFLVHYRSPGRVEVSLA